MNYPNMTNEEKHEAMRELICLVWLRRHEFSAAQDVFRGLISELAADLG